MPTPTKMQRQLSYIRNNCSSFTPSRNKIPPVYNTCLVSCSFLHKECLDIEKMFIFELDFCKPPSAAARKPSTRTLWATYES